MSGKGVADLLELGFDTFTLVKDDKDRLLEQHAGFGVSDGLLDRSESNIHITTSGTEDHALKADLFLSRDNTGYRRKTHVEIRPGSHAGLEQVGFVGGYITSTTSGQFRDCETGSIRHEKTTGLLEHFLEFNFLVVFNGELLGVRVELPELAFVLLKLNFEALKQLATTLLRAITSARDETGRANKEIDVSSGDHVKLELINFIRKESKLALQFIATLDVRDVTTLEGSQVGVQLLRERCKEIKC